MRPLMRPLPICGPVRGLVAGLFILSLTGAPLHADEVPDDRTGFGPAVDWSLTGRVSLSAKADLNRDLLPDETSDLLSTTQLDLGLSLGAETKRGVYTADLGLVGRVYLGPDQPTNDWPVDPRFAASARYTGKRYEVSNRFSFDIQPTAETQFDDTGIVSDRALQLSVSYSADLALEISRRDRLTVSASASAVDFLESEPGLVANRNFTSGLGWDRTLDARTSFGIDLTVGHFTAESALATRSQTIGLGANFSQQRTRRHRIGLGAGLSFVRTEERGRGTDFDLGFDGSASFGYELQDFAVDLTLSQGIEPSAVGQLQSFSRAGALLSWTVNTQDKLTLAADYTHRTGLGGGDALDTFSANASYALALTREARLSIGYRFRAQDNLTGFATGHQVLLSLSHDFTLLP